MCHLCSNTQARRRSGHSITEDEVPSRKDVSPFVATNKKGLPVTRLRAIITLRDQDPAFNFQTVILGRTPHISSGIGGLDSTLVPIQTREKQSYVSLPSRGVRGNGGVIFLPKAGSRIIQLYTWNTEPMTLNRTVSNSSHAEVQFIRWLTGHARLYPSFIRRIQSIQLFISRPPCRDCTYDLCFFAKMLQISAKISISWASTKQQKEASGESSRKLKNCGLTVLAPIDQELQYENPPRLGKLKIEKQQAHTYLLDKKVHFQNPHTTNRRVERLLKDRNGKAASLLSRVFASPHNYSRVKQLFQRTIDGGNFRDKAGGGWESFLTFKQPTGWSDGKAVKRLRAIIDQKGNWHYHPVP